MNQKLSDWANIAEIVSGLAVVITLVFLTLGLRDSTNTTRTLVYQQLNQNINDFFVTILQDDELFALWDRGRTNVDDLDDLERAKLNTLFNIAFRNQDAAFYAGVYESIGESEQERMEGAACVIYDRWNETFGQRNLARVSNEFRAFLEHSCGESSGTQ